MDYSALVVATHLSSLMTSCLLFLPSSKFSYVVYVKRSALLNTPRKNMSRCQDLITIYSSVIQNLTQYITTVGQMSLW